MTRGMVESFRRYFVRGLLALLPITLTVFILDWLVRFMEGGLNFLPGPLRPYNYLPFYFPGVGALTTILVVWLMGVFVTHVASVRFQALWDRLVHAIPFVSGIYKAVKQLVDAIFSQDKSSFRRVVLIEYPRKGIYSLGLVTGVSEGEIQDLTQERVINVFIPTTPNPTSGWYILVPEKDAVTLEMSVEEAFKLIISGGMVVPAARSPLERRDAPPSTEPVALLPDGRERSA
jgi:uncharacterized membrane protein